MTNRIFIGIYLLLGAAAVSAVEIGNDRAATGVDLIPATVTTTGDIVDGGQLVVKGSATIQGAGLQVMSGINGSGPLTISGASSYAVFKSSLTAPWASFGAALVGSAGLTSSAGASPSLKASADNSLTAIVGGTDNSSGQTVINLHGKSHATQPGYLEQYADTHIWGDATAPYTERMTLVGAAGLTVESPLAVSGAASYTVLGSSLTAPWARIDAGLIGTSILPANEAFRVSGGSVTTPYLSNLGGAYLAGNVGIGTTNPLSALTVNGEASASTVYSSGTTASAGTVIFIKSNGHARFEKTLGALSVSDLGVYVSGDDFLLADWDTGTKGIKINTVNGNLTVPSGNTQINTGTVGTAILGAGETLRVQGAVNAFGSITSTATKMSQQGGYLVALVNNQGATVSSGTVVNSTGTTIEYGFKINPAGGYMPIGITYGPITTDAPGACTDGSWCWICVGGRCMAQFAGASCAKALWAGASDTVAGTVDCSAEPASSAKHDAEVGHSITTGAAGTSIILTHFR